jgi:hypothetical protein
MLYLLTCVIIVTVVERKCAAEGKARVTPEQRREPDIVAFCTPSGAR